MIPESHVKFGLTLDNRAYCRTHHIHAITETGVQISSSGLEILEGLGCTSNIRISTSHSIRDIMDDQLRIKDIVFMCIKIGLKETRQVVYVFSNTSGFYSDESAMKDLGLIPCSIPSQTSKANISTTDDGKVPCGSPRQMTVPHKPARIPFVPTESNRDRLQRWLREHFRSSAFNICPHQPLKVMTGRSPDITFTREAKPLAVHTPFLFPHH